MVIVWDEPKRLANIDKHGLDFSDLSLAFFERALIRERQREGIALAKQRGAYRGRKKSLPSERIAELRQRVEAGEQKTKLAREFGISRETLYQYLRTDQ